MKSIPVCNAPSNGYNRCSIVSLHMFCATIEINQMFGKIVHQPITWISMRIVCVALIQYSTCHIFLPTIYTSIKKCKPAAECNKSTEKKYVIFNVYFVTIFCFIDSKVRCNKHTHAHTPMHIAPAAHRL